LNSEEEIMNRHLVPRLAEGTVAIPDFKLEDLVMLLPTDVQELTVLFADEFRRALQCLASNQDVLLTEAHVELFMFVVDDSTSIKEKRGAARAFCRGIKAFLQPFLAKHIVNAVATVWTMNSVRPLVMPGVLGELVVPDDYDADGHTPMIETMIAALFYQALLSLWYKQVLGKLLGGAEIFVGTTTVLLTDGEPSMPTPTAEPVKILVDYLQGLNDNPVNKVRNTVIGVGVGTVGTFRMAFLSMGIYLRNIFTVRNFGAVQGELTAAGAAAIDRVLEAPSRVPIALPGAAPPAPPAATRRRWWPKSK
jgi:hypothetical protein